MGGCFSSSGPGGEDAGYVSERKVRRVRPTDDDGDWDVDNKAAILIANFHSGVCDCDCPDQQQQKAAAADAA